MSTLTLIDLKGLPGRTEAEFVHSRTAAVRFVRRGKAVTAAGPHGAINVWRDSRGRLHAEFYRNRASMSHVERLTISDLSFWLRRWWPALRSDASG